MPTSTYPLTEAEIAQLEAIRQRIDQFGGLYRTDGYGRLITDHTGAPDPLDYLVLDSGRYLVDNHGRVWRFHPEGSSKDPSHPHGGGAPWRNNRVDMWNGKYCKCLDADHGVSEKRMIVAVAVDKRINGHPGMSQIDWYLSAKGYRHPLEGLDDDDSQNAQENTDHDTRPKQRGTHKQRAHSAAQADGPADTAGDSADSPAPRTHRRKG